MPMPRGGFDIYLKSLELRIPAQARPGRAI
jgi:hypothetical protein